MQDHNLLSGHQWQPFTDYGFTHKFWTLNTDTLLSSVIATMFIIIMSLYAYHVLKNKDSIAKFIILKFVDSFKDLLQQTLKSSPLGHLAFIGSLFTFIFCCNMISCIPFLEEPTKDLNTTLACGLIAFFYINIHAILHKGIKEYLAGFLEPFSIMLPLNIISTCTMVISLSFRLFGNIFGGYVITSLYFQVIKSSVLLQFVGLMSGFNLCFWLIFGFCEGAIQAFVFAMLTLTYLSMEIATEEETE